MSVIKQSKNYLPLGLLEEILMEAGVCMVEYKLYMTCNCVYILHMYTISYWSNWLTCTNWRHFFIFQVGVMVPPMIKAVVSNIQVPTEHAQNTNIGIWWCHPWSRRWSPIFRCQLNMHRTQINRGVRLSPVRMRPLGKPPALPSTSTLSRTSNRRRSQPGTLRTECGHMQPLLWSKQWSTGI